IFWVRNDQTFKLDLQLRNGLERGKDAVLKVRHLRLSLDGIDGRADSPPSEPDNAGFLSGSGSEGRLEDRDCAPCGHEVPIRIFDLRHRVRSVDQGLLAVLIGRNERKLVR